MDLLAQLLRTAGDILDAGSKAPEHDIDWEGRYVSGMGVAGRVWGKVSMGARRETVCRVCADAYRAALSQGKRPPKLGRAVGYNGLCQEHTE